MQSNVDVQSRCLVNKLTSVKSKLVLVKNSRQSLHEENPDLGEITLQANLDVKTQVWLTKLFL